MEIGFDVPGSHGGSSCGVSRREGGAGSWGLMGKAPVVDLPRRSYGYHFDAPGSSMGSVGVAGGYSLPQQEENLKGMGPDDVGSMLKAGFALIATAIAKTRV